MVQAFAFDVDNGGADPFGFANKHSARQASRLLTLSQASAGSAGLAVATAGWIAAASFTAGLAASCALFCTGSSQTSTTAH